MCAYRGFMSWHHSVGPSVQTSAGWQGRTNTRRTSRTIREWWCAGSLWWCRVSSRHWCWGEGLVIHVLVSWCWRISSSGHLHSRLVTSVITHITPSLQLVDLALRSQILIWLSFRYFNIIYTSNWNLQTSSPTHIIVVFIPVLPTHAPEPLLFPHLD